MYPIFYDGHNHKVAITANVAMSSRAPSAAVCTLATYAYGKSGTTWLQHYHTKYINMFDNSSAEYIGDAGTHAHHGNYVDD